MTQYVLSRIHMAPEEVFEKDHATVRKLSTQQTQNEHNRNHHPNFHLFATFENIVYCTRQVIAFWIQAVSFQQLPRGSLGPASTHSCGKARQQGVNLVLLKKLVATRTKTRETPGNCVPVNCALAG